MVKRLLPTPEICGSNPVIGKFYPKIVQLKKTETDINTEKEARNGPS